MISEQDKQAILKGAYGITREGNKVKFIGEREINNGFPYHFVILSQNDKILGSLGLTKNLTNQPEQESIHDVVGLWEDRPKPFNLEEALAGKPFSNQFGEKTYLLADVRKNAPNETKPLIGYIVRRDNTIITFNSNLSDLAGFTMWRD